MSDSNSDNFLTLKELVKPKFYPQATLSTSNDQAWIALVEKKAPMSLLYILKIF